MGAVFDIVILAVIVFSLISGWRNGLVKSVMGLASAILSFFAAVFFTPYLGSFICSSFVLGTLSSEVSETLTSMLSLHGTTESLFNSMPGQLTAIFERFGVDKNDFVSRFSSGAPAGETIIKEMSDAIVTPVAEMISSALAFIIIFIIVSIILKIVTVIIGLAFELPVLKQMNESLGLLFGAVCAVFYAVVLANAFTHIASTLNIFDPNTYPVNMIEKTYLTRLFSGLHLSMLTDLLSNVR